MISVKKLQRLGFYNNNQISRENKTFEDLLEDHDGNEFELAMSIVKPNKSDYNALKIRAMKAMKTVTRLDMLSPADCSKILENNGATKCQHQYPCILSVIIDTRDAKKIQGVTNTIYISTGFFQKKMDNDNGEDDPPKMFYEMNDIIFDHPLHGDPGSIVETKAIVEYLEEASFVNPK